jgi:FkbM family methyltransferase
MFRDLLARIGYAALGAGLRVPEISLVRRFSEQGHTIDLLNKLRINYVLDVGANKGWFAKHLRMMGYKGQILCFEPSRADCDSISRLAGLDQSWHIFNFALGCENTTKQFNVISLPGDFTELSSLLQPKADFILGLVREADPSFVSRLPQAKDFVKGTETIVMRRVDEVLDETIQDPSAARIFLKIDTQGYDLEVLKGCVRWIDRVSMLQSEISVIPIYDEMPHYTQALELYESLGFSLMNLYIVNRAPDGSIVEYDCVMARLDRFDHR